MSDNRSLFGLADSVMAYLKEAMPGFIRESGLLKEFVIKLEI